VWRSIRCGDMVCGGVLNRRVGWGVVCSMLKRKSGVACSGLL
jgi:hypothetical protein